MTRNQLAVQIHRLFSDFDLSPAVHACLHEWGFVRDHGIVSLRTLGRHTALRLAGAYVDLVRAIVEKEILDQWYGLEHNLGTISWNERHPEAILELSGAMLVDLTRALSDCDKALTGIFTDWAWQGSNMEHHNIVMNYTTKLRSLLIQSGFISER